MVGKIALRRGWEVTNVERCVERLSMVVHSEVVYLLAVEGGFQTLSVLSGLTQTDCLSKFSPAGLLTPMKMFE